MKNILENKEICSACGGRCCKKCGCDYLPKDFEKMSIDYLQQKLEEGNISIVSTLFFDKLPDGQITCVPFLYLRVRNMNRPIVDLLSLKTMCSVLKEDGCPYTFEQRPSGAKNVIPKEDFNCTHLENMQELMEKEWAPYQRILSRLVKRLTGYSVDERLSLDVYNYFKTMIDEDFENVTSIELEEARELLPFLIGVYKKEFLKVIKKEAQKQLCCLINK